MPVPKKRTSKSLKGMRRSHDALHFHAAVDLCDNCGEAVQRHRICGACGWYRGRAVLPGKGGDVSAQS